jgi:hypothetical protein
MLASAPPCHMALPHERFSLLEMRGFPPDRVDACSIARHLRGVPQLRVASGQVPDGIVLTPMTQTRGIERVTSAVRLADEVPWKPVEGQRERDRERVVEPRARIASTSSAHLLSQRMPRLADSPLHVLRQLACRIPLRVGCVDQLE